MFASLAASGNVGSKKSDKSSPPKSTTSIKAPSPKISPSAKSQNLIATGSPKISEGKNATTKEKLMTYAIPEDRDEDNVMSPADGSKLDASVEEPNKRGFFSGANKLNQESEKNYSSANDGYNTSSRATP